MFECNNLAGYGSELYIRKHLGGLMKLFNSYDSVLNRRTSFWYGLLLLVAPFVLAPVANSQTAPEGRWIGACTAPSIYRHLVIYIDKDDKGALNGFYLEPLRPENMM